MKMLKAAIRFLLSWPAIVLCKLEFKRQKFTRFNERPVEYGFMFKMLTELYPKSILDVGTGTTALPHLIRNCGFRVEALDNVTDYWDFGAVNRHYHVKDHDIRRPALNGEFEMVVCISVLEHIHEYDEAIAGMFSQLKPGGYLVISFPYNEARYIRNVYDLPGSSYGQENPFITQSYSRKQIDHWLKNNDALLLEQEYWKFWEGNIWTVGEQVIPPKKTLFDEPHDLTCLLLQKKST